MTAGTAGWRRQLARALTLTRLWARPSLELDHLGAWDQVDKPLGGFTLDPVRPGELVVALGMGMGVARNEAVNRRRERV